MSQCALCKIDSNLCDSHIVPEFVFKGLYDENHRFMGVTGTGNKGWKYLQKGIREKLLCQNCEQFINEKYEIPFQNEWLNKQTFPDKVSESYFAKYDYAVLKLFHLSVLFRASVSTLPTFRQVSLGKHQEIIRQLLLSRDPGKLDQYPIVAFAVLNNIKEVEKRLITMPLATKVDGHTVYAQVFCGVMWWISVSSHTNRFFQEAGLRESGAITFISIPWSEIGVMQEAKNALNRSHH